MNRNQIIQQIEQINSTNNAVEIYILAQPEIEDKELNVNFFKARLHKDIPGEIISLFYPIIEKRLIRKEYDVVNYNPSITPDRDVIWEQNSHDVPFYNFFHNLIENREDIVWYNDEALPYDEIWAYWIKIYGKDRTFYIIKKVTSSKVIRTGGKLALIFADDVFNRLDKDVLTLDGTFDAILCNQFLIFENKQNFEKALLYEEVKQMVAEETLDKIGEIGFLENFDQIKDFLKDDYHSINKLNRIKGKPYFKSLTFADCSRIIKDYSVDVDLDEATGRFKINSKQQAKLFIKVLNDDYLKSEMTNMRYAANSKEDV